MNNGQEGATTFAIRHSPTTLHSSQANFNSLRQPLESFLEAVAASFPSVDCHYVVKVNSAGTLLFLLLPVCGRNIATLATAHKQTKCNAVIVLLLSGK